MAPVGKKLIVITGPTASGKTDVAIVLAQEFNGAVVSADSRQVYARMNIGTAKPEFVWNEAGPVAPAPPPGGAVAPAGGGPPSRHPHPIPHYLFNIRRPNEPLSLSEWQAAAFECIARLHAQGSLPLLAGGTMLYIDSIVKNYDIPAVSPNEEFRLSKEKEDVTSLYAELLSLDPAAQQFIQPGNKRRIIRALEVINATGRPFSAMRAPRPPRYATTLIGLFDNWEALEARIATRAQRMMERGLIAETQQLMDQYGSDLPLLQTMNYQQARAVILGELSAESAQREMVRANLRYAHRQMSWWRGRDDVTWFSPTDVEGIKKAVLLS